MALADRRPLGIAPTSAEVSASPSFNPKSLIGRGFAIDSESDNYDEDEENDENEDHDDHDDHDDAMDDDEPISPSSRSLSPDMAEDASITSHSSYSKKSDSRSGTPPNLAKRKKTKNPSRAPIATGISTTIPVTGEKPRPEQRGDPTLEDDVLYAIFVILYERDPDGAGMTVKQICDVLVENHPDMAKLSTKTSNLVSAKLNAYVKRVEKGDHTLKYALSRDWADASPKRMVYVYRGLLAEDFHVHAKKLMDMQKQDQVSLVQKTKSQARSASVSGPAVSVSASPRAANKLDDDSLEAGKQASFSKARRSTMFDLGVSKNTFFDSEKSHLFVPYQSAPVTAAFGGTPKIKSDTSDDEDDNPVFLDDDEDDDETDPMQRNKRSKSMSYLSASKKTKIVTAAAAAPRASRAPSSHSANAAAAAAALHAAALKAIGSCPNSPKQRMNKKWLDVIRSGFLSQDIGAPEDMSLADVENFFK